MRRFPTLGAVALAGIVAVLAGAAPAGAQQLVDAGKQDHGSGGLAFVLFAAAVMIFFAALFFMDRIRRRSPADKSER